MLAREWGSRDVKPVIKRRGCSQHGITGEVSSVIACVAAASVNTGMKIKGWVSLAGLLSRQGLTSMAVKRIDEIGPEKQDTKYSI